LSTVQLTEAECLQTWHHHKAHAKTNLREGSKTQKNLLSEIYRYRKIRIHVRFIPTTQIMDSEHA